MQVNADLTFDGPIPDEEPWPLKFKVIILILVTVLVFIIGTALGAITNQAFLHNDGPFDPIVFESPARVVDPYGVVPSLEGLPNPALTATEDVPVQLIRNIDCLHNDCPEEAIPILVGVRWVQIDTSSTVIHSIQLFEDLDLHLEEGSDYSRGTTTSVVINLAPFTIPQAVVDHIAEANDNVTAWRIEGTTRPDRPDGVAAGWTTETFHLRSSP